MTSAHLPWPTVITCLLYKPPLLATQGLEYTEITTCYFISLRAVCFWPHIGDTSVYIFSAFISRKGTLSIKVMVLGATTDP